jgi:O-acetylhomoserine (thiol)-lyase
MSYEAYKDESLAFDTKQLHAGYDPSEHYRSKAVPIYQTAAFELGDMDRCERILTYREDGFSYVRYANPTTAVLEKRVAALEGGAAAVAFGSGMAAISSVFLNLARSGDEIVAVRTLYGGITTLLSKILPDCGIAASWVEDPSDPESFRRAIGERSRAVFVESLGNPGMNIIDIEAVARIAHERGIPLIVDNTFASPYLFRPFEFGADISIHSATKYIGGHGTTIGGLVVEKGGFDWLGSGFSQFQDCYDELARNLPPETFRETLFTRRLRGRYLCDLGGHISPISAFLLLQGLETLSLRMRRQVDNAEAIARFLNTHPAVLEVSHPSLPTSPFFELAKKYFPRGAGAILSFRLRGGFAAAKEVVERARIFDFMVNVGDVKSMIVHPATSTHFGLSPEEMLKAGVYEDGLRLSVGTEDPEDLIGDLRQALGDL